MNYLATKVLILTAATLVSVVNAMGKSGPMGPLDIFSGGPCDPDINEVNMKASITADEPKKVNISVDLPFEINKNTRLLIEFHKWENNAWQEDFYNNEAGMYESIDKFIPMVFEKFRSDIQPPIMEKEVISPGHYVLAGFEDTYESIEIPNVFYSRFRGFFTFSDDEHEDFLCLFAEFEALEP